MIHYISPAHLTLERLKEIIDSHAKLALSEAAVAAIVKCRKYLDDKMENSRQMSLQGKDSSLKSL